MSEKTITVKMQCAVSFTLDDFDPCIYDAFRDRFDLSKTDEISNENIKDYFFEEDPDNLINCVGMYDYEITEVIVNE